MSDSRFSAADGKGVGLFDASRDLYDPPMAAKKCGRCKWRKRSPAWRCRTCGVEVCEHLCAKKTLLDGRATCNACLRRDP